MSRRPLLTGLYEPQTRGPCPPLPSIDLSQPQHQFLQIISLEISFFTHDDIQMWFLPEAIERIKKLHSVDTTFNLIQQLSNSIHFALLYNK